MFDCGAVDTRDWNSRNNGLLSEGGQSGVKQDCLQFSPFKSLYASF